MKRTKQKYVPPRMEVMQMENEGVIAGSGNLPGVNDSDSAFSTGSYSSSRSGYNSASSSDLEDLINDILTIEQ
jgi:hypothetical protein